MVLRSSSFGRDVAEVMVLSNCFFFWSDAS